MQAVPRAGKLGQVVVSDGNSEPVTGDVTLPGVTRSIVPEEFATDMPNAMWYPLVGATPSAALRGSSAVRPIAPGARTPQAP